MGSALIDHKHNIKAILRGRKMILRFQGGFSPPRCRIRASSGVRRLQKGASGLGRSARFTIALSVSRHLYFLLDNGLSRTCKGL